MLLYLMTIMMRDDAMIDELILLVWVSMTMNVSSLKIESAAFHKPAAILGPGNFSRSNNNLSLVLFASSLSFPSNTNARREACGTPKDSTSNARSFRR